MDEKQEKGHSQETKLHTCIQTHRYARVQPADVGCGAGREFLLGVAAYAEAVRRPAPPGLVIPPVVWCGVFYLCGVCYVLCVIYVLCLCYVLCVMCYVLCVIRYVLCVMCYIEV
jgi:hypothetical protein